MTRLTIKEGNFMNNHSPVDERTVVVSLGGNQTADGDGKVVLAEVKSIKNIMRRALVRENLKALDLAIQVGVKPAYLSKILNERSELKISLLEKISKILKFSDDDFSFLISVAKRSVKSISNIDIESISSGNVAKSELLLSLAESIKQLSDEEAELIVNQVNKKGFSIVLKGIKRDVTII